MSQPVEQVLTVAAMRAAEAALIAGGSDVDALMQIAGRGAAEWVWRVGGHLPVTVLCGPGNNGGDGYVIAEAIRTRGGTVQVIAAAEPATIAAKNARALYHGPVLSTDAEAYGEVLVDCLFGSGLTRPLDPAHALLLGGLAERHPRRIAIDLPSGISADSGAPLNPGLPDYLLTVALGAWKPAHFLMPAAATMGALRLVDIGCAAAACAPGVIARPRLAPPAADAHKYTRGLLAVIGGAMPGAAQLACLAAMHAGAGYVRLLADIAGPVTPDLVVDASPVSEALADRRIAALLVGPGLGRDETARWRLAVALAAGAPVVLDADALALLHPGEVHAQAVATPHVGEFAALETSFGLSGEGTRLERTRALAAASRMTIIAKGPDTIVAAPDGRSAMAHRASSWLATAGTGDVLAGIVASRLAAGAESFVAACEGVWLHGEAARLAGPAFTAAGLAGHVAAALAECL